MKKFAFKYVKLFIISILILNLFTGCTKGDNSSKTAAAGTLEKSTLIMGLDDTFAPMGFRNDSGEIVGFDIDLAKEAAKRMDVTIDFQPIDWSMKEAELNGGNIDFIWNGYSITEERREKLAFSKPYLENKQIIITLADSPINTKADLAGKTVCIQAESSAIDAVNKDQDFVKSLRGGALIEFSTNNEGFNDLESGRSDALVVDEVLARYYMKQNGQEKYKILKEDFGVEEYAVGLRKDDTELLKKLDAALDEMKTDGTYDKIYSKWFSKN
jgi:polar amino acid transport system substrate-binding protein